MKKSHYIRQKFLVDEISSSDDVGIQYDENVKLEDIQDFTQGRNLFDVDSFDRKVRMSDFDRTVDTDDDFDSFVNKVKDVDLLYIVNDLPAVDNPIYQEFSMYCMKSLSKKLSERYIPCRFVKTEIPLADRAMICYNKGWRCLVMYPFMTLNDGTGIAHSEALQKDGREQVKEYFKQF